MNAHRSRQRRLAGLAVTGAAVLLAAGLADPAAARSNREPKRDEASLSRPAGTPVMAIVSIGEQRVSIYDAEGRILRAQVSTGQRGYETPAGIYSVIQKNAEHYSNLYDDASMPFMQRITWSGIALHAGALPGYPASHGCIRMPYSFAERLFDLTKMGMRVVVMPHEATPVAISHPVLFKPKPVGGEVAAAGPASGGEPGQRMRLGGLSPDANAPPTTLPPGTLQTLRSIAAAKSSEAEAAARKADAARLAATRSTGEAARAAKAVRLAEGARNRAETQLKAAEQAVESAVEPDTKERAEETKAKAAAKNAETEAQLETARAEAVTKSRGSHPRTRGSQGRRGCQSRSRQCSQGSGSPHVAGLGVYQPAGAARLCSPGVPATVRYASDHSRRRSADRNAYLHGTRLHQ